jgi:hypothetical protein
MRQLLAVAFLGATLAIGSSAALAGEKVDYRPSFEPAQSVSVVSRTESHESVVAGSRTITATSVFRQLREDNRER